MSEIEKKSDKSDDIKSDSDAINPIPVLNDDALDVLLEPLSPEWVLVSDTSSKDLSKDLSDKKIDEDKLYDTYIGMCLTKINNLSSNSTGILSSDDMDKNYISFVKYDDYIRLYKGNIHDRCCVDGFKAAAISNDLKIAMYIYAGNNVVTGERRRFFELSFKSSLGFRTRLKGEIPPDIFIISCESNSFDVISWMLKVETFDIEVLVKAFKSSIKKDGNEHMINIIFDELNSRAIITTDFVERTIYELSYSGCLYGLKWFYNKYQYAYPKLIETIFMIACENCYPDICRWIMALMCDDILPASLPKNHKYKIVSNGLKSAILEGSKRHELVISEIINVLIKNSEGRLLRPIYLSDNDPPDIFNIFYTDDVDNKLDKIDKKDDEKEKTNDIFVDAVHRNLTNTTLLMGGLKIYQIQITCTYDNEKPVTTVLHINVTNPKMHIDLIVSTLTDIEKTGSKEIYEIVSPTKATSKTFLLEKNILNGIITTFVCDHVAISAITSGIILVKKEFIFNKLQKLLTGSDSGSDKKTGTVGRIDITINTTWCVTKYLLKKKLRSPDVDSKTKDVLAKLLGDQLDLGHKFDYKKDIAKDLKIISINKNSDVIKKRMYQSEECMMCVGEYDMMLECGHVMCMCCAYEWYIHKKEPEICQTCRKTISLKSSYHLI
jgi:hypothetical protein